MFGFVAYQLWGTGLEYAQAQDRLDDEFAQLLAAAPATTTTTTAPDDDDDRSRSVGAGDVRRTGAHDDRGARPPAPTVPGVRARRRAGAHRDPGRSASDAKVVSGVEPGDLKAGPGHYPDTPMPGQLGNSAIAGHRTTYGQPFYRLDEVEPGDEIVVTTRAGTLRLPHDRRARSSAPTDSQVVATTDPTVARLTLTTCHPRYTAARRLIVVRRPRRRRVVRFHSRR